MGRRALSLAAIALWLGAGVAFAIFGTRSLRLEREAAQAGARRWAIATLDDAANLLATVVSVLLEKEPTERYTLEVEPFERSLLGSLTTPPDAALTLDQATYLERSGRPTEAEELLGRLASRPTDDAVTLTACLRAGALASARADVATAEPLLRRAATAGASALGCDGRPIAPAAWRLLAPIEAAHGSYESLTRLLDATGDGARVRLDRAVDAADLLLAAADDLGNAHGGVPPALRTRLEDAARRARHGHELLLATADRGVVLLGDEIAYRPVDDGPSSTIVTTSLSRVEDRLSARLGRRVSLLRRAPENALVSPAAPPFAPLRLVYEDWSKEVRTPRVAVTIWALGLGLYLVAGLAAILWFVRSARANRMQADFVAAVSHEMKTPIAGIQAMAEMLADGRVADPARAHAYAERIRAEASRLGAGVRNVLDAARIERDPSSIVRPVPTEPSALVFDLASVMRPVLEGRGFRFEVNAAPSPRPIPIDPDAFGSVVGNLLDNAAKFSTETKEIEVDAGPVANGYRVSVSDRGPGVPERERARVFERFERGEQARRMAVPGVGLGLHVARNLVEAHGGTIEVRAREGGGAAFVVVWPEGTA